MLKAEIFLRTPQHSICLIRDSLIARLRFRCGMALIAVYRALVQGL